MCTVYTILRFVFIKLNIIYKIKSIPNWFMYCHFNDIFCGFFLIGCGSIISFIKAFTETGHNPKITFNIVWIFSLSLSPSFAFNENHFPFHMWTHYLFCMRVNFCAFASMIIIIFSALYALWCIEIKYFVYNYSDSGSLDFKTNCYD